MCRSVIKRICATRTTLKSSEDAGIATRLEYMYALSPHSELFTAGSPLQCARPVPLASVFQNSCRLVLVLVSISISGSNAIL